MGRQDVKYSISNSTDAIDSIGSPLKTATVSGSGNSYAFQSDWNYVHSAVGSVFLVVYNPSRSISMYTLSTRSSSGGNYKYDLYQPVGSWTIEVIYS